MNRKPRKQDSRKQKHPRSLRSQRGYIVLSRSCVFGVVFRKSRHKKTNVFFSESFTSFAFLKKECIVFLRPNHIYAKVCFSKSSLHSASLHYAQIFRISISSRPRLKISPFTGIHQRNITDQSTSHYHQFIENSVKSFQGIRKPCHVDKTLRNLPTASLFLPDLFLMPQINDRKCKEFLRHILTSLCSFGVLKCQFT